MSTKFLTDAEVGEELGLTVEEVRRFCRERGWPHFRPKRSIWRFTEEHLAQIVELSTVKPKKATSLPASGKQVGRIPGQTARSAARRRS